MEFLKAKQEFQIRFYLWAISEWEKEINESYPNLRTFKSGAIWETMQFIQTLDRSEQVALAHGLLKRTHCEAAKIIGDECSPEEENLRSRNDDFFRIRGLYKFIQQQKQSGQVIDTGRDFDLFRSDVIKVLGEPYFENDADLLSRLNSFYQPVASTLEEEIALRRQSGEKIRFASKRKLQKAMSERFRMIFGDKCVDSRFDDAVDISSSFDMICCGWVLSTDLWFGRWENCLDYEHSITSPTRIRQEKYEGITAPALELQRGISFGSWLGIGQTQWEYLLHDDVEAACESVLGHCRHFFAAAPKLLKGLEFENITIP